MKVYLQALGGIALASALFLAVPAHARDCQIVHGNRVCSGDSVGGGSQRPAPPGHVPPHTNPPPQHPPVVNHPPHGTDPQRPPVVVHPPHGTDPQRPPVVVHPGPGPGGPGPIFPPRPPQPLPNMRHCYINSFGQRECYVDGSGGRPLPPQRPPRPMPPHGRPFPPHFPPPIYRPHTPVYLPPMYQPPRYTPMWDGWRIQNLVGQLQRDVDMTYSIAVNEASMFNDPQMSWATYQLENLQNAIYRMQNDLYMAPQSPNYTINDMREVRQEFEQARESIYWAYFSQNVDAAFDRVEFDFNQLNWEYWYY